MILTLLMVCCEVDEHQLCHNIQPVSCMLTGSYEFFFWQKFLGAQEKFKYFGILITN